MLLVLALGAAIWGLGWIIGLPTRLRWVGIGLLYVAVLGLHLTLPARHPLRLATGESPALWLLLGGAAALALIYGAGVRALKRRALARGNSASDAGTAPGAADVPATGPYAEGEITRYARHIVLRELGGPGQTRLKTARVLVIGAGGLGSPALMYLAAAGVGTIGVIDGDTVDASNLQRQVIHTEARIGMPKVFSAELAMQALNPHVQVRPYHRPLEPEMAPALFADYDLILDGTDNFETRYLVNRVAVAQGKPLVSGALAQWEGQLSVFDPAHGAPCYQCIFPEAPAPGLAPSCAEAGVIAPLPGVIGTMMAMEAIKVIAGTGAPLRGAMLIYDGLYAETRRIGLKPRPDCPVCGGVHEARDG
ncbi:HesA/MoeB/ThiF family protein [Pseudodonghicola flavimaris]|uniref:Molybdopterin-synthase adenylyltransferase MoeB n=1 Tax=Pseudodonghicola flavimaris TaxID=3050036 RepID=A0ABT7F5B4_9RHOB|nr:molybdopterin-synthase adenylyltransferase MoeB [Pseudodonghicola flavimaris]MDK3019589.1 molybdopterin-synthase adenylyltransferase MoeB [Pseudodonghicola flavimaris]